ncbi:hypothetical protein [Crocosphaera watsonii]|uniref:hypothetical protein n=1 Tax=Crocosphaera watsonii TaxID=263511 RepID=UPI000566E6BE|nr:hypothetical protein [Crocosphaera watsonii]
MNTTTRKQLRGYGLSPYLSIVITKTLTPTKKQGRTLIYDLSEVISAVRIYLTKTRLKPQTRVILQNLLTTLLERINNVVPLPFTRTTDPELSRLAKKAFESLRQAENHFANMKATLAEIRG